MTDQPEPQPALSPEEIDTESTGLPGMPSWRWVYLSVTGIFILYVVLLTTLMKVYS